MHVLVVLVGVSASAPAQEPGLVIVDHSQVPTATPVHVPPPAEPAGARVHDGFYARVAVGFGGLVDDFRAFGGLWEGTADGGSGAFEAGIGWTVARGLVIGGMFASDWVQNPRIEGMEVAGVGALTVFGPFADWYLEPTEGLHLQALLGGARIEIRGGRGERARDHEPVGTAILLGVGHSWWMGEELSLGVLGRLTGAHLWADFVAHRVAALSVLGTLTYH